MGNFKKIFVSGFIQIIQI